MVGRKNKTKHHALLSWWVDITCHVLCYSSDLCPTLHLKLRVVAQPMMYVGGVPYLWLLLMV